jgi:hypothetical protein
MEHTTQYYSLCIRMSVSGGDSDSEWYWAYW